jgi:hypothetical protein
MTFRAETTILTSSILTIRYDEWVKGMKVELRQLRRNPRAPNFNEEIPRKHNSKRRYLPMLVIQFPTSVTHEIFSILLGLNVCRITAFASQGAARCPCLVALRSQSWAAATRPAALAARHLNFAHRLEARS